MAWQAGIIGTQYQINYSFKKGYAYKIDIKAWDPNGSAPKSQLRLNLNNGSNGGSSSCTGPATINPATSGDLIQAKEIYTGGGFINYEYTYPPLSSGELYLVLAAVPETGAIYHHIEIQSILITEIGPFFALTPIPFAVSCGSTTPQTFSVTNQYTNPDGVTYQWNMGANNGWQYNNSQAPATFTTTTNSIDLTPAFCGTTMPGNFSVTVLINNIPYNTYTCPVTVNTPQLLVSGNPQICSGSPQTYSISNLPCNASVVWDESPSNLVTPSVTGNNITLSYAADGQTVLTATVTGGCAGSSGIKVPITVTTGNITGYYNVSSNYVVQNQVPLSSGGGSVFLPKNQSVLFSLVLTSPNLSSVSWSVSGNYSTYYYGSNFFNLYLVSPPNSNGSNNATVTLSASGPCGYSTNNYRFQAVTQGSFYSIVASPNPAKGTINVNVTTVPDTVTVIGSQQKMALTSNTTGITIMSLYDFNTNALVKQWTYQEINASGYKLNVAGVKSGIYVLKIERDNKSSTTKIILQ